MIYLIKMKENLYFYKTNFRKSIQNDESFFDSTYFDYKFYQATNTLSGSTHRKSLTDNGKIT